MSVRTRFAPSPTGYLHIGGVRTALFNWLLARQAGGQFILRIDDTDAKRNVAEALQPILDGFRWLGIDWDEGPNDDGRGSRGPCGSYFQSQRLEQYQTAVQQLLASGQAYRDYATPQEIATEREAAEKEKREFIYSRRWMAETDRQAAAFEAEGRQPVVRLKMPREGHCEFQDLIRGPVRVAWAREQDHVIQRTDGTCLYHLASVVDDEDFRITHVVRAIEHLSNTPRQIFIARALGYELPQLAHIPFVAEPGSKTKLSKRKIEKYLKNREFRQLYEHGEQIARRIGVQPDPFSFNPVLVDFYRTTGFLADAIINYLLLLGWSLDDRTEMFSRDEMIRNFSLERVVRNEASFDPARLMAFQARYMNQLDEKARTALCADFLVQAGIISSPASEARLQQVAAVVAAAGDRIEVAGDILQFENFFVADDALNWDDKAFRKRLVQPESAGHLLAEYKKILVACDDFSAPNMERVLKEWVDQQGIRIGDIIHALRVAVTGKAAGFGMFESLQVLGRDRSVRRIDAALQKLEAERDPADV
jgi:glutamyl-tRNA synthetase